jgi:hypothetical protein
MEGEAAAALAQGQHTCLQTGSTLGWTNCLQCCV